MYSFLGMVTEQWEIIYYVAFILLTLGIAFFTAKSYWFQAKKEYQIYCKCIESKAANYDSNIYLEIYNRGNVVVKDVHIKIQDVNFGMIPFLKPEESFYVPFAYFIHTMGGKILQTFQVKIAEDRTTIAVELNVSGKIIKYEVDIAILRNMTALNETDTKNEEKMVDKLDSIFKEQKNISAAIKDVSKAIGKIK